MDIGTWEVTKQEWGSALAGVDLHVIRLALDDLRNNGDQFPPTLPIFLKLCRDRSGIPDMEKAYQMALRRDFSHPVSELCFNRIGSWDFTHDSEKTLRKKFSLAYMEEIKTIKFNPKMIEKNEIR